jgi:large subunit ribosomal protein L25
MSEQLTLSAETRERAGKGASRVLRREGRVPAVVYGNNEEPLSIHLEEKALVKALSTGHFMNSVVMIDAGGAPARTLPKDVQFHPVTDRPLHVDFQRLAPGVRIRVKVPVHFANEDTSPGIKTGGVLNVVRREIEVLADPDSVPDAFEIDLGEAAIGDSLRWSAVKDTFGTKSVIDRDFVVATVAPPTVVEEVVAAPVAVAPPAKGKGGKAAAPAAKPAAPAKKK